VFLHIDPSRGTAQRLSEQLASRGILTLALDPQRLRFVTHLDVRTEDIDQAIEGVRIAMQG